MLRVTVTYCGKKIVFLASDTLTWTPYYALRIIHYSKVPVAYALVRRTMVLGSFNSNNRTVRRNYSKRFTTTTVSTFLFLYVNSLN
jgi:hypothetical protein